MNETQQNLRTWGCSRYLIRLVIRLTRSPFSPLGPGSPWNRQRRFQHQLSCCYHVHMCVETRTGGPWSPVGPGGPFSPGAPVAPGPPWEWDAGHKNTLLTGVWKNTYIYNIALFVKQDDFVGRCFCIEK